MGGEPRIPLQQAVKPGDNLDLRVNLIAPSESRNYTASWALQDGEGKSFGLGPDGVQPMAVIIFVKPVPPATPG